MSTFTHTHGGILTVATYEGRDYARARSALRIGGERGAFRHRASFGMKREGERELGRSVWGSAPHPDTIKLGEEVAQGV